MQRLLPIESRFNFAKLDPHMPEEALDMVILRAILAKRRSKMQSDSESCSSSRDAENRGRKIDGGKPA